MEFVGNSRYFPLVRKVTKGTFQGEEETKVSSSRSSPQENYSPHLLPDGQNRFCMQQRANLCRWVICIYTTPIGAQLFAPTYSFPFGEGVTATAVTEEVARSKRSVRNLLPPLWGEGCRRRFAAFCSDAALRLSAGEAPPFTKIFQKGCIFAENVVIYSGNFCEFDLI